MSPMTAFKRQLTVVVPPGAIRAKVFTHKELLCSGAGLWFPASTKLRMHMNSGQGPQLHACCVEVPESPGYLLH